MERAEFDTEGLSDRWWARTGEFKPRLAVLEDVISPDLVADLDIQRPDIPEDVMSYFQRVLEKLSGMEDLTRIPLNPDLPVEGTTNTSRELEILMCSRFSMDELLENEGALGVHILSTADTDPFGESAPYARKYRIAMVYDSRELIAAIAHEAKLDVDPERYLHEYIESWLNTLFHEIEHARLFAQNAAMASPDQIDLMYDTGMFDHDIFDCSSGYGIRPFPDDSGELRWSDTIEAAHQDMEDHVEIRGRRLLRRTLTGDLDISRFLEASGLRSEIMSIVQGDTHEPG